MSTPLTLVEKIATRYAVGLTPDQPARQGQIIRIRPKHVMTHDNTGAVTPKFNSIFPEGTPPRVADPSQPVFAIDHDIQNHSPENLGKYAKIAKFAADHKIDHYPAGSGISHQIMVEQGYAIPGTLIVGSDSHSNIYGGVSALGTPVVRTDAACIWATGQTWWQVPKVARCTLKGSLKPGVVGKDVIIALCGIFNKDEVLNHAVEFTGDGLASLSMDHRLTIANMTTEWGALAGVFPFDEVLKAYLLERADYFAERNTTNRGGAFPGPGRPGTRHEGSKGHYTRAEVEQWWHDRLTPDPDAIYAIEIEIDLATITPHVAGPNHVKVMTSVAEMQERGVPIQKAYLLSCTNARLADIAEAAGVVKGKKVAETVEFYIAAASAEIQSQAEALGHWQTLLEAGARPLPSGCGPCIGMGTGLVEAGEVAISATNRNFKGRMGSRDAEVYLGSPAVVAASAVEGHIAAPFPVEHTEPVGSVRQSQGTSPLRGDSSCESHAKEAHEPADILDGFPTAIEGRALSLPADNMNTDGIFAGKWTYKDDLTPDQMAEVIFENYDPDFGTLYQPGDILVGGRNFGTGSSREQAATALKYRGVPCVIAASFSETYRRNAFNNGFLCLECPALVDHLAETLGKEAPTIPGPPLTIDFAASTITAGKASFPFSPLSTVAQELVVAGGAEPIARASLG